MNVPDEPSRPARIDLEDPQAVAAWAGRFDATEAQLREAVRAVGPLAADVELHLKGSRAGSNSDRVAAAGPPPPGGP